VAFSAHADGDGSDIPKESNFDQQKKAPDKLVIFTLSKSTIPLSRNLFA